MIKHRLAQLVAEAVAAAQAAGKLPLVTLPQSTIEHPQNTEHGDYAANLPMKLARAMGRSPLEIAADIVAQVPPSPEIDAIEVARPGFINFKLNRDWIKGQVDTILAAGEAFGNVDSGQGRSVQVEFVSVNPTGPLHVGHARGAVLGSGLANLLAAAGYQVQKEYYVNDAGNQIDLFTTPDDIKLEVRNQLRQLELARATYPIVVTQAALAEEQVLSVRLQLILGLPGVRAPDLIEAYDDSRAALFDTASERINYITERARFALSLEVMMLDDTGFWPEINDPKYQPEPNPIYPWNAGSAYGDYPSFLKVSHEFRRMLDYPPPGADPAMLDAQPVQGAGAAPSRQERARITGN